MTDRVKGLMVSLRDDIRVDDIEDIINAIKCIKFVSDVKPSISTHEDWMNRDRIKRDLQDRLWAAIWEDK